MTPLSPTSLQQLQNLTRGQVLSTRQNAPRIEQSHLLVQEGSETRRISVEDYLATPQRYAQVHAQTHVELHLDNGQTLAIPLAELNETNLHAALDRALQNLNPRRAQQVYADSSELLQQIRRGSADQQRGPEVLVSFLRQNFQRIDQDNDGWLSENELKAALRSNQFNDAQKALLNRVLSNLSTLEEYSNDEWGDENDGVTLKDLEAFLQSANSSEAQPQVQSLTGWVSTGNANAARAYQLFARHMHQMDADHDGFVTREELQAASQNSRFSQAEKAWFAHLASQIGEIEELSNDEWGDENDGITLQDLEAYLRTNQNHGIEIPATQPEITGDLRLRVRDTNGFAHPGRNDLSGVISGRLTLDRGLIDRALDFLRQQEIPYVSIANTCFNPQTRTYEISISTLLDDFKIHLGVSPEGLPYLELSENWIPDDPILNHIQQALQQQLGSRTEVPAELARHENRIYLVPRLEQLQVPLQNRYVTLEEIQLTRENVRFELDRDGNFGLRLDQVPVRGSSGDQPIESGAQADEAELQVRVGLDLDENLRVQRTAIDLNANADIHLNENEQQEFAQYLRIHVDAQLAEAFTRLIFLNRGRLRLENLQTGFEIDSPRQGRIQVSVQDGQLRLSRQGQTFMNANLEEFARRFQQWQREIQP